MASTAAWAFEPDSALDVPQPTEQIIRSAATVGQSEELAVEYASSTVFDLTPPQPGEVSAPAHIQSGPVEINFTNASDEPNGSGLAEAALWSKQGAGGSWTDTGLRLELDAGQGSGSFQYANLLGQGEYFFAVQITDRAGNRSAVPSGDVGAKTVLDNTPPVITLLGSNPLQTEAGMPFTDPGATAHDAQDGDLTSAVQASSTVNTSVPGLYQITYTVQDAAGNAATPVVRTVQVIQSTTSFLLTVNQPNVAHGSIGVSPSANAADGRYLSGTEVTLTFVPTADYDLGSWNGAQPAAANPMTAMVVMDSNKTVGVSTVRATGTVVVEVTPSNASWSLTDGDGASHTGTGGRTLSALPTGTIQMRYNALQGYQTPAQEVGTLARGGTLTFSADYTSSMDFRISAPRSLSAAPGETIDCPVNLTAADGVTGFAFTMTFDSALAEVQSVRAGGLTTGWSAPASTPGSGSVQVSGSGPALSSGGGSLAIVTFKIRDNVSESDTTELSFSNASLTTASGPAPGVTAENGLLAVELSEFRWGDADANGEVNFTDSNVLLRYATGLISELPVSTQAGDSQFLGGADVNADGRAGAYDAALILQFLDGGISQFPADLNGDGFGPDLADKDGGEGSLADLLLQEIDKSIARIVRMNGSLTLDPGTTIDLPIAISAGARVMSYFVEVFYDPTVLTFDNLSKSPLTDEWLSPILNNTQTGRLVFAAAGSRELDGAGALAELRFRVVNNVTPGHVTSLRFGRVELNDGLLPVQLEDSVATPKLNNLSPNQGADLGGTAVTLKGLNLAYVDTVYFGNTPAMYVLFMPDSASLLAVAPPGTGSVDVTVSAVGQVSTLNQAFSYFPADIRLTLLAPGVVGAGEILSAPIASEIRSGSQVTSVTFIINYDRRLFAAVETSKTAGIITVDSPNVTSVQARVRRPGQLEVTLQGNLQNGPLCTANLVSIGSSEEIQSILYISDVTATGPQQSNRRGSGATVFPGE